MPRTLRPDTDSGGRRSRECSVLAGNKPTFIRFGTCCWRWETTGKTHLREKRRLCAVLVYSVETSTVDTRRKKYKITALPPLFPISRPTTTMAYSPSPAPRRRRLVRRASKSPESSPNRGRRNRRYSSTPPSNRRITIPSSSPPLVAARRRLSSTPPRRRRSESPPLSRRLFRRDPRSVSPKSGDRTPNTLSSRQYGAQRGDRWRGDTPIPDTCFSSSPPYTPRSQRTTDLSDDDSQGDNLLPGPSTVRPEGQATPVVRWCWEFSYEAGGYVRREYVHTSELTPEGSLCDYEEDVQEGGQTPLTLRRFLEEDDEGDMPVGYDAWNLPSPSARSVENILASDTGITTQYDAPSPTPSSSRRSWTPSEEIEEHLDEVEEPRKPIKPRKRKIRRIPPPVECNSNPPPNHKLLEINGENFTGSRRNASAYKQYKTFEKNLKGSNGEWRSAMACMKDVGRTKGEIRES